MATVTWPWYLPQHTIDGGFSFSPQSNLMSTKMSTGYSKIRRRTTKVYKTYTVSMEMTLEEFDNFETFFENDLGEGVLPFTMFDPLMIAPTIDCIMVIGESDSPYNITPLGGSDDLLVSFKIEILE